MVAEGAPSADVDANVAGALAATDLGDVAGTAVRKLSGGMRQRLAIAQALVSRPHVLVMDEPSVGLDPQQRAELRALLVRLREEAMVVLATHLVEDVAAVCDAVVVLHRGRLAFSGPLTALAARGGSSEVSGRSLEAGYLAVVTAVP